MPIFGVAGHRTGPDRGGMKKPVQPSRPSPRTLTARQQRAAAGGGKVIRDGKLTDDEYLDLAIDATVTPTK